LPDVSIIDGDLRISPLRKNTPEAAEAFAETAFALMPHVKITGMACGSRSSSRCAGTRWI